MKALRDFDLHIFDLDDTLINTRQAYFTAQESAVRKAFPRLSEKELSSCLPTMRWMCGVFGSGNVEQYMQAFLTNHPELPTVPGKTLDTLLNTYRLEFWSKLNSLDGAPDFLRIISAERKRLSLVSNGRVESQRKKLDGTRLRTFFPDESCFISEQYLPEQKKPSPHMVDLACRKAETAPENAVFYGNTNEDILAGNLAGTTTAFYRQTTVLDRELPSLAIPDMTFSDWREMSKGF
ncbi:MAG: HAD hydrolase-like protein [Proteobacteria bacterium]|nr:HAD hydrolase-like protein [Pseudomonadota bacterium]